MKMAAVGEERRGNSYSRTRLKQDGRKSQIYKEKLKAKKENQSGKVVVQNCKGLECIYIYIYKDFS
jgi:hypothetical protein